MKACKMCGSEMVITGNRQRFCPTCAKQREREKAKEKNQSLRLEILANYGDRCACCGEDRIAFLTIDHINGGGNAHRRELASKGGKSFYYWLKRNGYPAGFRVLCFNCNHAKAYGRCPHEESLPGGQWSLIGANTSRTLASGRVMGYGGDTTPLPFDPVEAD